MMSLREIRRADVSFVRFTGRSFDREWYNSIISTMYMSHQTFGAKVMIEHGSLTIAFLVFTDNRIHVRVDYTRNATSVCTTLSFASPEIYNKVSQSIASINECEIEMDQTYENWINDYDLVRFHIDSTDMIRSSLLLPFVFNVYNRPEFLALFD
jgi:hypothetical protein